MSETEPLRRPAFARFWAASAVSTFGISIVAVAVDVLVIRVLHANEAEVGLLRAVQFLPYLRSVCWRALSWTAGGCAPHSWWLT